MTERGDAADGHGAWAAGDERLTAHTRWLHASWRHLLTRAICGLTLIGLAAVDVSASPDEDRVFQDWVTRCNEGREDGAAQCFMFQNLVLKEGGQRLLHIAVGYLADDKQPSAALTVPLGVSLKAGLTLQVEDGRVYRVAYDRCDPNSCVGTLPLNGGLLYTLKMRGTARVTFEDGTGRKVVVPVSLMGFTAALESLQ